MNRQEQALWFINGARFVAIALAVLAVGAVIFHLLRNLFPRAEEKLNKKQLRRQQRKLAKANRKRGRSASNKN